MTDKEVLQKAIEVAIENGYELPNSLQMNRQFWEDRFTWFKLYFSHDFAKAFFPNGEKVIPAGTYIDGFVDGDIASMLPVEIFMYEYYLMQMVRYSNPIDYLRKFVDNTESSVKK